MQVLRVMGQWDMLDEFEDRKFAANDATKQLVRGKAATLGSFVDHQVFDPSFLSVNPLIN